LRIESNKATPLLFLIPQGNDVNINEPRKPLPLIFKCSFVFCILHQILQRLAGSKSARETGLLKATGKEIM